MLEIQNYFKEITPADVDRMYTALMARKAQHEREIALGERAADALEGVRHYMVTDARLCNRIRAKCAGVNASVRYDSLYSYALRGEYQVCSWQIWQRGNSPDEYACVYVQLPRGHSVGELIEALRANTISREWLARVERQIDSMEEMIDAEERLRAMVKEIERLRDETAKNILNSSYHYFDDAVREILPALTGKRH